MQDFIQFQYGFASWDDAVKAAEGYDKANIIETVRQAAARVVRGEAVYEVDGVNLDHIRYSWPLTASLMYAAANLGARQSMMRVLDFGGALGTTFQQNRRFLMRMNLGCDWRIVEQPAFVDIGQREFTGPHLRFFPTIEAATLDGFDVALFGGCLGYVPDCYRYLDEILALEPDFIVMDRTAVTGHDIDLFAVQHVPPSIYRATYAVRTFSYQRLIDKLTPNYILVEQWACDQQPDPNGIYVGLLLQHKRLEKSHLAIP